MMAYWFTRFAKWASWAAGNPLAFMAATVLVIVWAIFGPIFGFSDTWQLAINTFTTITTFLMVFLIQNTQSRDTAAIRVKLDELIRAVRGAHNVLLGQEELDEAELDRVKSNYEKLGAQAREEVGKGGADTTTPEVDP